MFGRSARAPSNQDQANPDGQQYPVQQGQGYPSQQGFSNLQGLNSTGGGFGSIPDGSAFPGQNIPQSPQSWNGYSIGNDFVDINGAGIDGGGMRVSTGYAQQQQQQQQQMMAGGMAQSMNQGPNGSMSNVNQPSAMMAGFPGAMAGTSQPNRMSNDGTFQQQGTPYNTQGPSMSGRPSFNGTPPSPGRVQTLPRPVGASGPGVVSPSGTLQSGMSNAQNGMPMQNFSQLPPQGLPQNYGLPQGQFNGGTIPRSGQQLGMNGSFAMQSPTMASPTSPQVQRSVNPGSSRDNLLAQQKGSLTNIASTMGRPAGMNLSSENISKLQRMGSGGNLTQPPSQFAQKPNQAPNGTMNTLSRTQTVPQTAKPPGTQFNVPTSPPVSPRQQNQAPVRSPAASPAMTSRSTMPPAKAASSMEYKGPLYGLQKATSAVEEDKEEIFVEEPFEFKINYVRYRQPLPTGASALPFKIVIRKAFAKPATGWKDPLDVDLTFARIENSLRLKDSLIPADGRATVEQLVKTKQKVAAIETAMKWPLYFAERFGATESERYPGKTLELAIQHRGLTILQAKANLFDRSAKEQTLTHVVYDELVAVNWSNKNPRNVLVTVNEITYNFAFDTPELAMTFRKDLLEHKKQLQQISKLAVGVTYFEKDDFRFGVGTLLEIVARASNNGWIQGKLPGANARSEWFPEEMMEVLVDGEPFLASDKKVPLRGLAAKRAREWVAKAAAPPNGQGAAHGRTSNTPTISQTAFAGDIASNAAKPSPPASPVQSVSASPLSRVPPMSVMQSNAGGAPPIGLSTRPMPAFGSSPASPKTMPMQQPQEMMQFSSRSAVVYGSNSSLAAQLQSQNAPARSNLLQMQSSQLMGSSSSLRALPSSITPSAAADPSIGRDAFIEYAKQYFAMETKGMFGTVQRKQDLEKAFNEILVYVQYAEVSRMAFSEHSYIVIM